MTVGTGKILGSAARSELSQFISPNPRSPSSPCLTARFVESRIPRMLLPHVLRDRARHVGGRLNDLRVHLIGTLRRDKIGNFLHRIDIGAFGIALTNQRKPRIARKSRDGRARSLGL